MFLWINMRTDTDELAVVCREKGLLLAPGSLFSPHQMPRPWMRFNMTTSADAIVTVLGCARSLQPFISWSLNEHRLLCSECRADPGARYPSALVARGQSAARWRDGVTGVA
jgi:hypothetical protein